MANVGDLFINVRAKTSGLTKGLRSARRSLKTFAKSAGGIVAGIGAAFGIFKLFSFAMGSLIGHSRDFRRSWSEIQNAISQAGAEFATQFGPQLSRGLTDLSKWVSESESLRLVIAGIGPLFTDIIIPAVQTLWKLLEPLQKLLAWIIEHTTGTSKQMKDLGLGISDPDDTRMRGGGVGRRSRDIQYTMGSAAAWGRSEAGQAAANRWLQTIAENVEVPK
tara:strand:+ start:650 stop:1309 length:660 start_codon:yes stop_codon:yes gene_type:complete